MTATENDTPTNEPGAEPTSLGKKRRGLVLGLGIGAGTLALAILALTWVLNRGVTEVATMDQMVVPEGWSTGVAPSGDFGFAYSAQWQDSYNENAANYFAGFSGPGFVSELGGIWLPTGTADYPTAFEFIGQTHTERTSGIRTEVDRVVRGGENDEDAEMYTVIRNETFDHPLGFSGWYKVNAVSAGLESFYYRGAIGISNGNTVVFVHVESWSEPAEWEDDFKDAARSIVILRSPEEIQGS